MTPQKPRVVKVPDVTHPTYCYVQKLDPPLAMWRCTKPKGHDGPHSWEQ